jgi:hypothetical protein
MKSSIKIMYSYIALLFILFLGSCKKELFTSANNNPNAPGTVTPANLLPGVETSLGYQQGGDIARYTSLLTQQDVGFSRQAAAYYSYIFTSTDFDTPWGNMYTSVLGNDKDLLAKADAAGYNAYSGIGRIILAFSLQTLVDEWGNIPYSQALQGDSKSHPGYDDQTALYDTIKNLLDAGIAFLNNPDPGGQTPGTDDMIYGGDASLWIKFAHAIKARLYIHQSKGNETMAVNALTEANMSFADNSEGAQFIFGTTETFSNPIYQYNEQRADIDYGSGTYVDMLTSLHDPRLGITADPTYSDVGQVGVGNYYGNINGHVEFIMYEELNFLKAEATLRATGDYATAQTYYQAGITASMEKLGISNADIATYIAARGTLPVTSVDAAIAAVAVQEYLALYQNPEVWTLWRRTGSPALAPVAGSNGIPRRFLYPQTEYSLNGDNTPQATLYAPKVFWDK